MTFDWWTLVLQAINFLVLVWLMQRFLYKPVKDIIQQRRMLSEQAIREGEQAKAEAEAAGKRYDRKAEELVAERQRMLDDAHRQIGEEQQRLIDKARTDAENIVEAGRKAVAAEKDAAMSELRSETAGLAVEMASKILREAGVRVPSDVYLQVLVEQIKELPESEYRRLIKDLAGDGAELAVITAYPLDHAEQDMWLERLRISLGKKIGIKFQTDPDLIGGAQLRFPHTNLMFSWADELEKVKDQLVGEQESS